MDELVTNSGFLHIKEQIFGYLDAPTLVNCVLVSKNWNSALEKSLIVRKLDYLLNVDKPLEDNYPLTVSEYDHFSDLWKYLRTKANLEELRYICQILDKYREDDYGWSHFEDQWRRDREQYEVDPFFRLIEDHGCLDLFKIIVKAKVKWWEIDFGEQCDTSMRYSRWSILHEACREYSFEIFELLILDLLKNNIDLQKNYHFSKLVYELDYMHEDDREFDDEDDGSVLHEAVRYGTVDKVKLLIDHSNELGLDVNCKDVHGRTPIFNACHNESVFRYLLDVAKEKSIAVNVSDKHGYTLMHLRDSHDFQDPRFLYGYIPNDTIAHILLQRSEEFQIDVNAKNAKHGMTPLHHACKAGRTELVSHFLDQARDKGIDVCARDSKGKTILHHAFWSTGLNGYSLEKLKELFQRAKEFGLTGDERDVDGNSALDSLNITLPVLKKKRNLWNL